MVLLIGCEILSTNVVTDIWFFSRLEYESNYRSSLLADKERRAQVSKAISDVQFLHAHPYTSEFNVY